MGDVVGLGQALRTPFFLYLLSGILPLTASMTACRSGLRAGSEVVNQPYIQPLRSDDLASQSVSRTQGLHSQLGLPHCQLASTHSTGPHLVDWVSRPEIRPRQGGQDGSTASSRTAFWEH
jgi:hypothetical protein